MLTRGNVKPALDPESSRPASADGGSYEDSGSGKRSSASNREKCTDDKASVHSESSCRSRKALSVASETTSPVLVNQRTCRSSTRKTPFIMDLSSEDTPLSIRQATSVESGKRKRLKLCSTKEEDDYIKNRQERSHSEGEEEKQAPRERPEYLGEDGSFDGRQEENPDGIRRSTRTRKQIYDFSNTSWLVGEKTAKGYPKINSEENGMNEGSSRVRRTRRSPRIAVEGDDEADDEDHDDHDEDEEDGAEDSEPQIRRSARRGTSSKRNVVSRGMRYSKRESKQVGDESCMYSRIKNSSRRLRSSSSRRDAYSGFSSTVRNAKKTPAKMKRAGHYDSSSEGSDVHTSGTESEHDGELHEPVVKKGLKIKSEDQNRDLEIVDGKTKGKYTLRKAQPVARYRPYEPQTEARSRTPPRSRSCRFPPRGPYSPAHRPQRKPRQKAQNESSTSSSSSDDERFERRKNKSMIKARNRCLPMNFPVDEFGQGVVKDRMKIGSSLADVDPMNIDRNVTFESVGGLETYIRSLKEMILFPLLYPEVFQKFSIQAPRGVLFYGPPGTGKTLVARCLANECSQKDRRVAFFMRKGADCLSKWVGESERQLRLLFDQAYQMRPSIIFFDEIDGLAPVRSTRQDQIHSSIVSTLLALMDGLDSRGEVIIIGATNRLDAIDPALRRPGRFDREFHFPLPSLPARKEILNIHLKSWSPSPSVGLVNYLSQKTVGYCGADLKALCAEAALLALRRRYPQVYQSRDKLLLDLSQINVERRDFDQALLRLVPASQRSAVASGKPLSPVVAPLLQSTFQKLIKQTQLIFPEGVATLKLKGPLSGTKKQTGNHFFPRLLVSGDGAAIVTAALLHHMERLPVHRLDLSTLNGLSVRTPEEACVQLFHEARRNVPAIIYLPLVGSWWPVTTDTVRATFLTQLSELDPELPILLLATDDGKQVGCCEDFRELFHEADSEVFRTRSFTEEERRTFFQPLRSKCLKPPIIRKVPRHVTEVLPLAPPPPPRQLNEVEKERLEKKEEATLRELRIFLREILAKLARNKLFYMFTRPVDTNEVPDYQDVIKQPMDLETMMTKIDLHAYESAKDFLSDIELICSNALEYNPDRDPEDKMIRHRACTLRDTAYALIKAEMDTDFEEQCQEISKTRKARQGNFDAPHLQQDTNSSTIPLYEKNGTTTGYDTKGSKTRSRRSGAGWSRGVIKKTAGKRRKAEEAENCSLASAESSVVMMDTNESNVQNGSWDACHLDTTANNESDQTTVHETLNESQNSNVLGGDQPHDKIEQIKDGALDKVVKKVPILDVTRLDQVLQALVVNTEGWHLENLLRLYSKLARVIDRYQKLWERSSLIEDLEHVSKQNSGVP